MYHRIETKSKKKDSSPESFRDRMQAIYLRSQNFNPHENILKAKNIFVNREKAFVTSLCTINGLVIELCKKSVMSILKGDAYVRRYNIS